MDGGAPHQLFCYVSHFEIFIYSFDVSWLTIFTCVCMHAWLNIMVGSISNKQMYSITFPNLFFLKIIIIFFYSYFYLLILQAWKIDLYKINLTTNLKKKRETKRKKMLEKWTDTKESPSIHFAWLAMCSYSVSTHEHEPIPYALDLSWLSQY